MNTRVKQLISKGIFGTGWKNGLICLFLATGVYVASKVYAVLNHGPAVLNLRTPLDDVLPVVPIFVIPYNSLEPLIYFTMIVLLLTRTRIFQAACCAMLTAWLVSYAFYIFLQSEVLRPVLTESDVLTQMIRDVYANDNPFNAFPSLHTSLSTIIALHWWRVNRRLGIVAGVWVALIVASTVLIKQHYVADVASGLLLALGASWLWMRLLGNTAIEYAR
jgi:membrane-associated phospholipid phosphatase